MSECSNGSIDDQDSSAALKILKKKLKNPKSHNSQLRYDTENLRWTFYLFMFCVMNLECHIF